MGSVTQEPEPERILKTDLREYSKRTRTDGPYADDLDIDVLIVGAGFGGKHLINAWPRYPT
jgi:short-subunit dehydrogenase